MAEHTSERSGNFHGSVYRDAGHRDAHGYLLPVVLNELRKMNCAKRLFDLGCGNGSAAAVMAEEGWDVTGVDVSEGGLILARDRYPELKLFEASAYDDLAKRFGTFPVVTSLEVVEHLFQPRRYVEAVFSLLEPGGTAIISTPYHGYWKNLALALSGKMDAHFTALWEGGHIKFFSERTLRKLLVKAGFEIERVVRVGRIPPLAKSMIAVVKKPAS